MKVIRRRNHKKLNEGFSFYDDLQWMPNGETAYENNFRDFCRKHGMMIKNKKLYKLCENLYDIIRYHIGVKQDERLIRAQLPAMHRSDASTASEAFYGIKTFIYNRLNSTEHYSEIPTQNEINRLKSDLFTLARRPVGNYNFNRIAQYCEELLDDYCLMQDETITEAWDPEDEFADECVEEYKEAIEELKSLTSTYKYLLDKKVIDLDDMAEMVNIVNEMSDNLYNKVTHKYYTVKNNVKSLYNY